MKPLILMGVLLHAPLLSRGLILFFSLCHCCILFGVRVPMGKIVFVLFFGGGENLSFVCVICFLCVYYSRHSHYTFPGCFLGKQSG